MKTTYIFLFVLNMCVAQAPLADFEVHNCQPIKGDFLWAAKSELTNFQYLEFLHELRIEKGEEFYKKMLPDTLVWRSKLGINKPYVNYYFRHPAYRDYPVVGVTKEQVESYCEWLEMTLNQKYENDPKHQIETVDVRLPTDEEWQHAARGGNPNALFPWEGNDMRRTDKTFAGQIQANYVRGRGDYMGVAGELSDNADVTAPGESYWPNAYGLYNMSGNVAEMLQEEGRTRGGSWRSRAPFLEINGKDEFEGFTEPSDCIGFRYFIEVIDFKPVKAEEQLELTAKLIEELLQSVVEDSLYVSKYEVTNEFYSLFLNESENGKFASDNELWLNEVDYARRYSNDYTSHPKYKDYPVVNITKEGAVAFCDWLTNKYNAFSKTKFQDLSFRLPTEDEWEVAARGGLSLNPYPWGGPYVRNSKGDMLCNYNPVHERWILDYDSTFLVSGLTRQQIKEAGRLDGHLITAPVNAYSANGFGAYNMSGNVAEMVSDKNVTRGGSWGSFKFNVRVNSSEPDSSPSPYIGFRFVAISAQ